MRQDGHAIYYTIEHFGHPGGNPHHQGWVGTSLGHMMFDGLSFQEKRGEQAAKWRKLIERQGASTDLWQRYGISGYANLDDAKAMIDVLRERRPAERFRIVRRQVAQLTEVVHG